MSVTIRNIRASVNVPNPTASSTFDSELESYLSKAIATGETSGIRGEIHGIIQGFKLYPNPDLNNSWTLTATPTSIAVFRNPSGGDFLYLETTRSFGFTIGPEFDEGEEGGGAIACLVPDFVTKRVSIVLYTIEEQISGQIPESSILLGVLLSTPEIPAPGFAAIYSGVLPLGEEIISFHRTQYDPDNNLTAVYKESFVGVNPSRWVTTSGLFSVISVPELRGSGKTLQFVLGEGESATITFPHIMTPYFDYYGGDLVNANNKVRAKVTYYTSEDFEEGGFEAVFVNQSNSEIQPFIGAYWIPTPISSPRSFYVEISPDPENQDSDGNYRLRFTGTFIGELYITGVEFEVDLDSSVGFVTNVIYVPKETMKTSLRVIEIGPLSITGGEEPSFTIIDIDSYNVSEETMFVTVLCDPTMTTGVFAYGPDAFPVQPVGLYIPPGQAMQLGPFRRDQLPKFGGFESGAIYVSILPVVSEG